MKLLLIYSYLIEFNGLYNYNQKDKVPQWKHPLD